jgi:hypothetical protein
MIQIKFIYSLLLNDVIDSSEYIASSNKIISE